MRKCKRGAKPYLIHPAQNQRVGSHKKTPEVCIPQRSVRPYDSTPSDCSLCLLARSGRTDWTGGEDRSWCGCPLPLCSKTLGCQDAKNCRPNRCFAVFKTLFGWLVLKTHLVLTMPWSIGYARCSTPHQDTAAQMNITIRLTKVEYEMLKELQKKDKRYKRGLEEKVKSGLIYAYDKIVVPR